MPQKTFSSIVLLCALSALLTAALPSAVAMPNLAARSESPQGSGEVSFNRDIRPLLVKNCFACHGDAKLLEGNVMLKSFADATGETGYEPVVVPGNSAASPMYKRITAGHQEMLMPPPETGKRLTQIEIERVARWIDSGAEYEQHWSYMPVERPQPPLLESDWIRNPIDAFLLQAMQARGLQPSPPADDRTLVRRLSFDLNGLVPDIALIEQHADLAGNDARYSDLVNDLLASPHFGERMAVPWLDWVKYSDEISDGGNYLTTFYPYRNYVIRAFNDNKPFNEFTIEQVAGDLLPERSQEQLIASAYNHLIVRVQDGVGLEAIHKYLTERVDKLGQIWLASSLECAQCHDHKFDVWSQKQYYQFAAFFADLDRVGVWSVGVSGSSTAPRNPDDAYFKLPRVYMPTAQQKERLAEIDAELAQHRSHLSDDNSREKIHAVQKALREQAGEAKDYYQWIDPDFTETLALGAQENSELDREVTRPPGGNGAIVTQDIQFLKLKSAEQPGKDYQLRFSLAHDQLSALMLRITKQGGDSYSFNELDEVAISEVEVSVQDGENWRPLKIAQVESTDLGRFNESLLIDGNKASHWSVRPEDIFNKYRYERKDDLLLKTIHNEAFLVFYLDEPLLNSHGKTVQVKISHRDEASRARSINLAYTAMLAASPFQKHAAGPVASAGWLRTVRQRLYDFVHKYVFFTDFWDFTASQVFTWMATNAGVSAPVPFNDIMKSVLATIKERFAYAEIFQDHVVLRSPPFRDLGIKIRLLEREREKIWGEVERSWVSDTSTKSWPVRVLKGGQISDTSGEQVGPALPDFLNGSQAEGLTRLDLAQWLVADNNPLTSRVMVNRIWRLFMGNALVPTLEEFGSGGELPSHPELLDWLAAEFVASGWDIKHLVRLIVSSSAYRQQSLPTPELWAADPENLYFARQSRFRIDAEFVQDFILKSADMLEPGLYGEHTEHGSSAKEDRNRRSIYLLRRNIIVQPELKAFGARPREKSVIHRSESITPIQALASLNQPLVIEASERLAEGVLENAGADALAGQRWLYRKILQRDPLPAERTLFTHALKDAGSGNHDFWVNQARTLLSLREASLRS